MSTPYRMFPPAGFRPIQIPPGVVATPTKNVNSSNWAEANNVRWVEGQMTPIGGQAAFNYSFASRCKMIHGWYDLAQVHHIAYLCQSNLYVDTGGVLTDITPAGGIVAPSLTGVGGYGDDVYCNPTSGTDLYGEPRSLNTIAAMDKIPDAYSLENFGAVLYAMTSPDGWLLEWDPAIGGLAVHTAATAGGHAGFAPQGRCFVVTQERFLVIFATANDGTAGGGSQRRFMWCDQENPHAWDVTNVTSQAGFLDIEPASPILCAIATRSGTLFWTGKKAYISSFLGLPYVYNCQELADNCTPWSSQSMVTTSAMVIWMSQQGVFSFNGTSIAPIACMVRPWVDDDIDLLAVREQSFCCHIENFSEWWWFFPQFGQPSNTRAIIYNYKEGWWGQSRMTRTAGITSSYTSHAIMADGTTAFQHEIVQPGQPMTYARADPPFAETFDLNLIPGGRLITIKQLLPDIQAQELDDPNAIANAIGLVQYSLFYRNSRSLGAPEQQTPPMSVRSNGYVDMRVTGRDIRLRFQIANPSNVPQITVGAHLIDGVVRGDR